MPDEPTMTAPSDYNRVLQESIRRKDKLREATARLAELERKLAEITSERDEFADALVSLGDSHERLEAKLEAKLNAAPDELQGRINELEGQLLSRDRTAEFNKLAKEKGIKDEHFEDAIKLLGWKPDGEDHDPAKLGESLDGLVGRFPLFKGDAVAANPAAPASGGGAAKTPTLTPKPPGPGNTRGGLPTVKRDSDAELADRYPNPTRLA